MSAPVANANYAPNGYEKISDGHYRRREDDPEAQAAKRAIETVNSAIPQRELDPDDPYDYHSVRLPTVRMKGKLVYPEATRANRLDQIATLIRLLTYGEMMDLAAAIWKARPADADGAISLKLETLPGTLHRWSAK